MARAADFALFPIRDAVIDAALPRAAHVPDVTRGALGDKHTALGAVALALRQSGWLPLGSTRTTPDVVPTKDEVGVRRAAAV
jgi:hypothetical protein